MSFGRVDAAVIFSQSTALADAVATATANRVSKPDDIEKGMEFAKSIDAVKGVLIILGSSCGAWGEVELVSLGNYWTLDKE